MGPGFLLHLLGAQLAV